MTSNKPVTTYRLNEKTTGWINRESQRLGISKNAFVQLVLSERQENEKKAQ